MAGEEKAKQDGVLCPRCGRRGHVIGQPNHLYDSGVPMRCYDHGGYSWGAYGTEALEESNGLTALSKANAAKCQVAAMSNEKLGARKDPKCNGVEPA